MLVSKPVFTHRYRNRNTHMTTINLTILLLSFQTIAPNKYDAMAEFHTGETSVTAHGGCNFHGWHRMYILM